MSFSFTEVQTEALRRLLADVVIDEEDQAALDEVAEMLGPWEQRPADRVPEMRRPEVQAAMRAAGADDAAIRKMLRGGLAEFGQEQAS